jgi:hypothetical protein
MILQQRKTTLNLLLILVGALFWLPSSYAVPLAASSVECTKSGSGEGGETAYDLNVALRGAEDGAEEDACLDAGNSDWDCDPCPSGEEPFGAPAANGDGECTYTGPDPLSGPINDDNMDNAIKACLLSYGSSADECSDGKMDKWDEFWALAVLDAEIAGSQLCRTIRKLN